MNTSACLFWSRIDVLTPYATAHKSARVLLLTTGRTSEHNGSLKESSVAVSSSDVD